MASKEEEKLRKKYVLYQMIRFTHRDIYAWDISVGFPCLSGLDLERAETAEDLLNTIHELIILHTEMRIKALRESLQRLTNEE